MTNVTDSLFVDSNIWLGYFLGNIPASQEVIDSEKQVLFTSILSLFEIARKLKALGKTEKETENAINFVESNSIIVNVNKQIVLSAVDYYEKYCLHTIDALIFASAMETKTELVTADKDFGRTPNTRIIRTG